MRLSSTILEGVYVLETDLHADDRGFFARTFDADLMRASGLATGYPQHSIAHNTHAGTLRGMHYQREPHGEEKIVRCIRGAIFDVVVDIRRSSSTFGRWFGLRLDQERQSALYIPRGYAHGYQTLVDDVDVAYLISQPYTPEAASGIHHADPALGISWPLDVRVISARDRHWPHFPEATL